MEVAVANNASVNVQNKQLPWAGKVASTTTARLSQCGKHIRFYATCSDASPEEGRTYVVYAHYNAQANTAKVYNYETVD